MSVSMAMVPVALAMRAVMGKDHFEKWVDSMQVKIPTELTTDHELRSTLMHAGYGCEKWGGSYKTHIRGEEFFFWWDLIDGKWTAVFGKSDSQREILAFIQDVENKAGRHLFLTDYESNKIQVLPTETFPTNFADEGLLLQTLREYGTHPQLQENGGITAVVGSTKMRFRQSADGPYSVELDQTPEMRDMFEQLLVLDEEYKRCLQAQVYEKLKQRASDKGLVIENERVLGDNSIMITLNIKG